VLKRFFGLSGKYVQMLASDPNAFTGQNEPLMKSLLQMWAECFQGYFYKGYLEEMIAHAENSSTMSHPVDLDKEIPTGKMCELGKSSDLVLNRLKGKNAVAADFLKRAQEEFSNGNFISAIDYGRRYSDLIDYDCLERIIDHESSQKIEISVVIVTFKRNEDVRKALESLRNQNTDCC
jgi:tRNA(Glu) U13 pseudouridine synthase TruD